MDDYDGPEVAGPFTAESILREELQTRTGIAAATEIELSRKGPLYDLLMAKRQNALKALDALIDVHPQQTNQIIGLQEQIKSFLADCEWVHARLEDGREADSQIAEIWGAKPNDDPGTDE